MARSNPRGLATMKAMRAAALIAGTLCAAKAQQATGTAQTPQRQPTPQVQGQRGAGAGGFGGGGGRGAAAGLFTAADINKDGFVTREELKTTFAKWFSDWDIGKTGSLTRDQLMAGLTAALPQPGPGGGRGGPQNQTPKDSDVQATMAALPDSAPVAPKQPRKVLVLAKASGFVHSSIPIGARTVEEIGKKTGAWSTTISYDAAVIAPDNLKQYDAIFLASTTGAFLDDPNDQTATDARKKALLSFVRGGKGLAGMHAATDSYHGSGGAAAGGAGGAPGATGRGANTSPSINVGTWPEFNKMIGGWFKFHWNDPQHITVKIDDPNSPINAPFKGQSFGIDDETYTFVQDSWSRENVHVLTSIDYSKMSDEDKAKEPAATARTDHDYGLSWIRREGKGRVFYEAHGHNEKIYAIKPMLEHVLAGVQYALGDLQADDSPSVKPGTKGNR